MRRHLALAGLVVVLAGSPVPAYADTAGGSNGRIAYSASEVDPDTPPGSGALYRFWAVDPDGADRRELLAGLVDDHSDPSWSPDGRRIAFYRDNRLVVAGADGSEERELLSRSPGRKVSWSPDGTRLAYVVQDEFSQDAALWVMNVDGTDPRQLIHRRAGIGSPAWSPRGDEIAFSAAGPDNHPYGVSVIYAVGVDGSGLRQVTQQVDAGSGRSGDGSPAWSPDGTRVAFVSGRDLPATTFPCYCERTDLYLASSDGRGEITRIESPGNEGHVEWSPDGTSLAYMWMDVDGPGELQDLDFVVRVRDLGSGAVRQVSPASVQTYAMSWTASPGSRPAADLVAGLGADRTSVLPGTPVTLTATVRNDGPGVAESAAIELRAAPGSTFDPGGSAGCTPAAGGSLICAVGALPSGGQASVTVRTTTGPAAVGDASALAISATSDPDTTNNRAALPLAVCTQVGTPGRDRLTGSGGQDILCGGGGDDVLTGGGGDDLLLGGAGRDELLGGSGRDTASYAQARSRVRIDLGNNQADGDGKDRLRRIENATGGRFADRLLGSTGGNVLNGGAGDDRLAPGRGRDQLVGGLGRDRLDYRDAQRALKMDLQKRVATGDGLDRWSSVEGVIGSRFADHVLGSITSDWVAGGGGSDRIEGLGASDRVSGGSGDDVLQGGDGNDRIKGGSGVDRCRQDYGRGRPRQCEGK